MAFKLQLAELFRKTNASTICQNELMHSQFWSRQKLKDIQWQRVQSLLHHAYCNVPYYRRVFNEIGIKPQDIQSLKDLQRLPVLTKDEIRRHYQALQAKNAQKYKPRLISSGGSTGKPIRFFIDKWTNGYQWADVYRGQIIGGWNFGDRIGRIWGSSVLSIQKPIQKRFYAGLNDWCMFPAFDAGEEQMRRWLNTIRRQKIRFLGGYVDTIVDFARLVIANNLQTQLVAVFPTTAPLTPSGRRLIEKAFGCGIFDLYQSADGGLSATECHQHQGLHIAEEHCLVEAPESHSEHDVTVVVTDLFNYAMPFIRYKNEDEIVISNDICSCGRESRVIKRVRGKIYHHILLPNGERVHSEIFSYHLNNFLVVKHFCARQTSPRDILLEISLDERYAAELPKLKDALSLLPASLSGINIEISYVDEIKKHPNQKYMLFIPYEPDDITDYGK